VTVPFELIIFDCDGVLVDSERLSIRVDAVYLEKLGWPMSETEIIERFVGRSDADMRTEIERHIGGPIPADIEESFERLYRETFAAELAPVDGIREALDLIPTPRCVASSGDHAKILRNLALTGLTDYFGERIFSATDVAHGKPAPDLFLHAARSLGADPARCAVVEDSIHGVEAALAAGMHAFAYAGGVTSADRLARPGAVVFTDMRQLPGLLEAANPPMSNAAGIQLRPTR
jgi:HAD superfamily hydrolase (TIGR01509 family)